MNVMISTLEYAEVWERNAKGVKTFKTAQMTAS